MKRLLFIVIVMLTAVAAAAATSGAIRKPELHVPATSWTPTSGG